MQKNTRTEFFECVCLSNEHTIRFELDVTDSNNVELYTSVFLNQYRSFLVRLWVAIKYLFKYKCKEGHWDCTIIKLEDTDRLISLLKDYKRLSGD